MAPAAEFHPWRVFDPDEPTSILGAIRGRRWTRFVARFPELSEMTVLDLGGTPRAWAAAPVLPRRLVILNTEPSGRDDAIAAEIVTGDACDPPACIRADTFDLVYSNSVIEHVGGHDRRKRFAETARVAAPHHWIQTPYRYFPVEPHFLFPGYQFLPLAARTTLGRHWGPTRRSVHAMSQPDAVDYVQAIELLSVTDMAAYFPDSEIARERLGGMVKSLIAIR
jgi:Methyltransferase domain